MPDAALASPPGRRPAVPGVAVILALLLAGFALGSRDFLAPTNLLNVIDQSAVLMLLALPMTFIIMTEGLDLSAGAVVSLASVAIGTVAVATGLVWPALLAGVVVGLGFGAANGVLVAFIGLPPFVATLGTLGIAQGLALVASGGQSITGIPPALLAIYGGHVLGLKVPAVLLVAAWAAFAWVLHRTTFGSYVFALGGNREALRLAGVRPAPLLVAVYALGGLMAGLAGLLLASRLDAGHPTAGIGMEFDAIAAVAVGGTSFERGDGRLGGTVLGVFAIGILRNGLNLLAWPSALQVASVGVLVILALLVDVLRPPAP
jgi:ribose transport system permease protein